MRRTHHPPWTLCGMAILGISGLAFAAAAVPLEIGTDSSGRPGMIRLAAEETITVTGRIEAAAKDVRGMTTALQIADENSGGRFLIAKDARGKELMSHVGKVAMVKGVLRREASGQPVLAIQSYQLKES